MLLVEQVPAWARGAAAAAAVVSAGTLLVTYQRGAFVVAAVELVLVAGIAFGPGGRRSLPRGKDAHD